MPFSILPPFLPFQDSFRQEVEKQYKDALDCVKLLLQAGAFINKVSREGTTALERNRENCVKMTETLNSLFGEAQMLLYAAGEKQGTVSVPGLDEAETLKLKHLCREVIRSRLITLDPESHLFNRIPLLKLPSIIQDYLLYGMSLETEEKTSDLNGDSHEEKELYTDYQEEFEIPFRGANDDDESENEDTSNRSDDDDSGAISGLHGIIPPFLSGCGPLPGRVSLRMSHEQ